MPSPAAQRDADAARAFGGKLQPARRGHRQPGDLADDRAGPAMAQPLLETGQNALVVARLDIDHPVGQQPGLGEGRGEQVRPGDAPEHLAAGARGDAGGEQCRRRAIERAIAAAGDLVQRAAREPSARQPAVQRGDAEGQHRLDAPTLALDGIDLGAQGRDGGFGPHDGCRPPGADDVA